MTPKSRRRTDDVMRDVTADVRKFPRGPTAPVTIEDRRNWKGFCEIESEPALFNVMLKQFGVRGVKVQEVVSLDDEMLSLLPRPVYGLIFLFRWREEAAKRQEQSCPKGVWFANQTINNACASVALLNIVNNVPDIELGESLKAFKDFTMDFSPALRGDAISNFDFVKQTHNSFARKVDILNTDLLLKNEAITKVKGNERRTDEHDGESAFHFIAFLTVDDKLWKLDGLERQPMCLGPMQGDWVRQAKPDIEARMAQYDKEQIEFAILSLVKDPLLRLIPSLAANVKSIAALTSHLEEVNPDWRKSMLPSANGENTSTSTDGYLTTADGSYGLEQHEIDDSVLLDQTLLALLDSDNVSDITAFRQKLVIEQAALRMEIQEERQSMYADESRAAARSQDFGAKMQTFASKVKAKEREG